MTFSFVAATQSDGASIKLPKEVGESITITVGNAVRIQPVTDYNTKAPVRNSKGAVKQQWVLDCTGPDGTQGRLFIDRPGLKNAIGRAMLEHGIDGFFTGDTITITFSGKVSIKNGNSMNAYSVQLNHSPEHPEVPVIDEMNSASGMSTDAQIQAGYNTQVPVPPQGYPQPPAPQGYATQGYGQAPAQGYSPQPPQGYSPQAQTTQHAQGYTQSPVAEQPQAPVPPQGYGQAPVPPAGDGNPWG